MNGGQQFEALRVFGLLAQGEDIAVNRPYSQRFMDRQDVQQYDSVEYAQEGYAANIWEMQKAFLNKVLSSHSDAHTPEVLLDFACGTGRILNFLENKVARSDGLDVSDAMTEVALRKCPKSQIFVGDITKDIFLACGPYTIITCFRFLLNAEQTLRLEVLKALRKRLDPVKGILVINVHGNKYSARHIGVWIRRWLLRQVHNELSRKQIKFLFDQAGFEIVHEIGFGVLPPSFYRTPLKGIAKMIDRACSRFPLLTRFSIDLVYVCRIAE